MGRLVRLSVVIPTFNEEENVGKLHKKLVSALKREDTSYEIIFVNDGSTDLTLEKLKKLNKKSKKVKVINFRRNFGQTAAMAAGIDYSKGEIIVTMDADLQNDPKDIPRLLDKLNEGYDAVSGWRKDRKDDLLTRKLPSLLANRIISFISGVKLHDFGCTLKAYKADIIKDVNLYGEMHRFIPAIISIQGAKIGEIKVTHHPRKKGESKYGIDRIFRVFLDLLTVKFLLSYQTRPLHLFGLIGVALSSVGSALFAWLVYGRLFMEVGLSDRPLFLVSILFIILGAQIISMGLLAEMVTRVYFEVQNKRTYYIKEIIEK